MAVGHAPVPFQIKTVDGAAFAAGPFVVGPFCVLVFGSSPPITMSERLELYVFGSLLPFSLPKLGGGLPPPS